MDYLRPKPELISRASLSFFWSEELERYRGRQRVLKL